MVAAYWAFTVDVTGSLVRLRALRADDAEAITALLAEPDVVRDLASWAWAPYGIDDARQFLARRDEGSVNWAIEDCSDGAFVGVTGLQRIDHQSRNCEWGIWTGPPSRWGRGLGTEACTLATRFAFHHLGLEKVYLFVYETNARGRRVYEKAGYHVEGTLPRDSFVDGRLVTAYVMSVFRDHPRYAG